MWERQDVEERVPMIKENKVVNYFGIIALTVLDILCLGARQSYSMYVCMLACMCVFVYSYMACMACMSVCVCMYGIFVYLCSYGMRVCMYGIWHLCMYVCMAVWLYGMLEYVYPCVYVRMYVCMHACMYVMPVCMRRSHYKLLYYSQ